MLADETPVVSTEVLGAQIRVEQTGRADRLEPCLEFVHLLLLLEDEDGLRPEILYHSQQDRVKDLSRGILMDVHGWHSE